MLNTRKVKQVLHRAPPSSSPRLIRSRELCKQSPAMNSTNKLGIKSPHDTNHRLSPFPIRNVNATANKKISDVHSRYAKKRHDYCYPRYTTLPSQMVYFTFPYNCAPRNGEFSAFDSKDSTVRTSSGAKITMSAAFPSSKVPQSNL